MALQLGVPQERSCLSGGAAHERETAEVSINGTPRSHRDAYRYPLTRVGQEHLHQRLVEPSEAEVVHTSAASVTVGNHNSSRPIPEPGASLSGRFLCERAPPAARFACPAQQGRDRHVDLFRSLVEV